MIPVIIHPYTLQVDHLGFSTDQKPTHANKGAIYFEQDTELTFHWNGEEWIEESKGIFVRNLLWNTESWEFELATTGSPSAALVSVDNFPAVISGVNVPVTGTFYPVTQPVSAVSLPLPAGASTETTLGGVKTGTDRLDILVSALRDAITAASPNNKTLNDIYTELGQKTEPANTQIVDIRRGKTILFVAINQGASGTTQLVAADVANKIKLVSYVIVADAAGTAKFNDGTADLTGAMSLAANGGVSAQGNPCSWLLETVAINRPLNIITTGACKGHISYFLEA